MRFRKFLYNAVFVFLIANSLLLTFINLYPYIQYFLTLDAIAIGFGVLCLIGGCIAASFLSVFLHEVGHMLFSLFLGFKVVSFTLFNRETIYLNGRKTTKKIKNNFSYGSCELINTKENKLKGRYIAVISGGLLFSFLVFIAYLLANVLLKNVNPYIYLSISMGMTISLYIFLASFLPAEIKGTHTDGGVIFGLTKNRDFAIVLLSLLKIQTKLYDGNRPCEIDRDLYFNVPLLSDDHISMMQLYSLRQLYYLDKKDYEKASETNKRLMHFSDAMTVEESAKLYLNIVFDLILAKDYEKAKATYVFLMDNIQDNMTSFRIRAYYSHYVEKNSENAKEFIKKAENLKEDIYLKGIVKLEENILNELSTSFS